jgi:methyl-accepting chemotaxis protein
MAGSLIDVHHDPELNVIGRTVVAGLAFLDNVRVRLVGVIISALMIFMLAVGIASGVWSSIKVGNIATHWHSFDTGAASKRTLMDQIRAGIGYGGLLFQVKEILANRGDPVAVAAGARQAAAQLRALVAAYRSAGVSPREEQALTSLVGVLAAYESALDGIARGSRDGVAKLAAVRDDAAIQALSALADTIRSDSEDSARAVDAAVASLNASSLGSLALNGVLLVLLAVFFHWFTRIRIVQPLNALGQAMIQLTRGNKAVEVPFQDKRDEVGEMARSVQVFKENAIRLDRMAEERRQAELAAEEAKRREMQALADHFEHEVKGVVDAVAGAAAEMQALAQEMTGMTDSAVARTGEMVTATTRVSSDVSAAAAAAEELAASIHEIRRQVGESGQIAGTAVRDAGRARAVMGELSQASERIDSIVRLIEALAQRIDLLALNATIEAMRAGEFGKGFAVVAGEVKNLATQTGKATEQIGEHIAAIQRVSGDAVHAIGAVCGVIERMDAIAREVDSAVVQQSEATAEITRGVDRTATETRTVSDQMAEVAQLSTDAGGAAVKVLAATQRLGTDAARLSSQVQAFVAHVRSN